MAERVVHGAMVPTAFGAFDPVRYNGWAARKRHTNMKTNTPAPDPNSDNNPWLNTDAACKYLRVKRLTIYRWVKAKTLNPKRLPGGELRFRRSDLDDLLS